MKISVVSRGSLYCKIALGIAGAAASLSLAIAADPEPASGVAKGTFTQKDVGSVTLTNVAAFVDEKDDAKPTIVILSDKKLPTEKWTSEFDLMEAKPNFSGVLFWLDKDRAVFRWDMYWKGKQSSVSGFFDLKLDSTAGAKEIKGSAHSTSGSAPEDPKLDVVFHATLK